MPMSFRRLLLVLCLWGALIPAAHAQVKASLVADETSVKPGRAFTVALRLEHQPHWHTYWINPGTGIATSLKWTLPPGWTASEIRWPTPTVIKDKHGTIVGNGYEDEVLLPVTITPSADAKPGDTVKLRAKAAWLMCADVCVPGDAPVELSLPVATELPSPNAPWHEKLAALSLPQASDAWTIRADRQGKTVVLSLKAKTDHPPKLNGPRFFSEDGFIQYDEPQTVKSQDSGYELVLPVSESAEPNIVRLVGVVSSQSPLTGIKIDIPLNMRPASQAIGVNASPSGTSSNQDSLLGVLVLAFVGGMILNLMPCVFPVLGIKILGFVNQSGADRKKVTMHGLVFTAGVLASFWALAATLAVLRGGGAKLGWGFQLQSPTFVFGLAVVMLIFALSMSGLFEIGLRATGVGSNLQSKSGYAGSFFTGVLATVVATPCSAPFLAPALGAALALPTTESFAVFTAIAVGLSTPYLLLSIFPGAVRFLPRPGAWMETFKQVMAFPLYATVAFLVWVLAGQTKDNDNALLSILFGLTLVAMAGWLYGRYTAPGAKPGRVRFGVIGGFALLATGTVVGWPHEAKPTDLVWQPWSAEAVEKARAEGRIVYVDFTARWCATCQANKKLVFGSDEVKKFFRDRNVAMLKADWTNQDSKITAELAKWNRSAVPFNLVYKPGATEPVVLPELLTAGTVLSAVQ